MNRTETKEVSSLHQLLPWLLLPSLTRIPQRLLQLLLVNLFPGLFSLEQENKRARYEDKDTIEDEGSSHVERWRSVWALSELVLNCSVSVSLGRNVSRNSNGTEHEDDTKEIATVHKLCEREMNAS